MVVRLVFKEDEVFFLFAVHLHLFADGAGVDLVGYVQAGQEPLLFRPFGVERGHVHQADILFASAVQGLPVPKVLFVYFLYFAAALEAHVCKAREEGGVAGSDPTSRYRSPAVLSPWDRAASSSLKYPCTKIKIVQAHGKAHVLAVGCERVFAHRSKALQLAARWSAGSVRSAAAGVLGLSIRASRESTGLITVIFDLLDIPRRLSLRRARRRGPRAPPAAPLT